MKGKDYYSFVPPLNFSSNEMIEEIKLHDSTISFIGYIDEIHDVEVVGIHNRKLFKFFVNNNSGHRILVKVWEHLIKGVTPSVQSNEIIHLDGVAAKPVNPAFNKGTTSFEFSIQSNTRIHCLGKRMISKIIDQSLPDLYKLEDVGRTTEKIRIEGFIKTTFENIFDKKGKFLYLSGSVTDGVFKLETRIQINNQELTVEKGDKIELTGCMKYAASTYFNVDSTEDVIKKEEKMSIEKVFAACQRIKRVISNNSNEEVRAKKYKI